MTSTNERRGSGGSYVDVDFAAWYEAEFGRLVGVLARLGVEHEDADDLASEAFSRALQRWNHVGRMDSPTAWVYRVALNLLRRRARRRALERRALLKSGTNDQRLDSPPVWDAVTRLPPRQQTAIVLHYLLDLPYEQVANVMGIAAGTVAATLSAARRNLQTALGEEEEP